MPFIHHYDELREVTAEEKEDERDKRVRSDLGDLLDIISSPSGDSKLARYFRTREDHKKQRSVTFETLWTIFRPGMLVYGKPFLEQDQVFLVLGSERTWPNDRNKWILYCLAYDWAYNKENEYSEKSRFERSCFEICFKHFEGTKRIATLPFVPFGFDLLEGEKKIEDTLIKRGRKFRELCRAKEISRMRAYDGKALTSLKGFTGLHGNDEEV